jgi:hypothetical protein
MKSSLHSLLPGYLNHSLAEHERKQVAFAIQQDDTARAELQALEHLQGVLKAQAQSSPQPLVRQQLMSRIRTVQTVSETRGWRNWGWGSIAFAAITLSIFLLLWLLVQPGVSLEWSAAGQMEIFRIYRLQVNRPAYELVGEVTGHSGISQYQYTDAWLWPGQHFTYLVEGIDRQGQIARQTIYGNALVALPSQVALLLSSAILAGLMLMFANRVDTLFGRRRLILLA